MICLETILKLFLLVLTLLTSFFVVLDSLFLVLSWRGGTSPNHPDKIIYFVTVIALFNGLWLSKWFSTNSFKVTVNTVDQYWYQFILHIITNARNELSNRALVVFAEVQCVEFALRVVAKLCF